MLFLITSEDAYELAGVADAAALVKDARPILEHVLVTVDIEDEWTATLSAVATDSHMLGCREITFSMFNTEDTPACENFRKEGTMVNAKEWKRALKAAAVEAGHGFKIILSVDHDQVAVSADHDSATEFTVPTPNNVGNFPKWQQLIKDEIAEGEFVLPALNPVYLGRVQQIVSAKPADRDTFPVRLRATGQNSEAALKPWVFVHQHGRSRAQVVVMPVRV